MTVESDRNSYDVLIIGGGAAGLMAAVLLSKQAPALNIAILDGAKRLGAKILISGGGRCNVTNAVVTAKDFQGGSRNVVKRILKAWTAQETVQFFTDLGVKLHEEEHGKLFPDSNKARTVLDALINTAEAQEVEILTSQRVESMRATDDRFEVWTERQQYICSKVILATGGRSIPKTGSDGFGYEFARSIGHQITPTFPALVPLLLKGDFHQGLSGISLDAELTLRTQSAKPVSFSGSLLWTHLGVSGPVVLNISRHWHAARLKEDSPVLLANFLPNLKATEFEEQLLKQAQSNPKSSVRKFLEQQLPNRFVEAIMQLCDLPLELTFSELTKKQRKSLVRHLMEFQLLVTDSRGFGFAEATAGGVPLNEINPSTMESRKQPGFYFVGEILDVDGNLGGYNFQWAWSSAAVAANGIVKSVEP